MPLPKYTIAAVVGQRPARSVLVERRPVAAYARSFALQAIDEAVAIMRGSEDDKARIAAAALVLKVGGHLGAGEKDAQFDAAVEAKFVEYRERMKAQLAQIPSAPPASGSESDHEPGGP